jgi:hypothetical protein
MAFVAGVAPEALLDCSMLTKRVAGSRPTAAEAANGIGPATRARTTARIIGADVRRRTGDLAVDEASSRLLLPRT